MLLSQGGRTRPLRAATQTSTPATGKAAPTWQPLPAPDLTSLHVINGLAAGVDGRVWVCGGDWTRNRGPYPLIWITAEGDHGQTSPASADGFDRVRVIGTQEIAPNLDERNVDWNAPTGPELLHPGVGPGRTTLVSDVGWVHGFDAVAWQQELCVAGVSWHRDQTAWLEIRSLTGISHLREPVVGDFDRIYWAQATSTHLVTRLSTVDARKDVYRLIDQAGRHTTLPAPATTGSTATSHRDLIWTGDGTIINPAAATVTACPIGDPTGPAGSDMWLHTLGRTSQLVRVAPNGQAVDTIPLPAGTAHAATTATHHFALTADGKQLWKLRH